MKRMMLTACLGVAILLPGNVIARQTVNAAPSLQTARRCYNIQLNARPVQGQGAAGHLAVIYRLHNLWNGPCTLYGYPGVQLLDRNFHSLPTHPHRSPGNLVGPITPRVVQLGPHGNAYFALGYSDVPINNQPCPMAPYLMIFPPNAYLPIVVYAGKNGGGLVACSGNINITPLTAQPRYQ